MEFVINFSGGKDSSAMLAYLCDKFPYSKKSVVFADTGWEYQEDPRWASAENWSRQIVENFGLRLNVVRNANKDFFGMVRHRQKFPSPAQRQCTSDLKRNPIQTWIRRNCKEKIIINCMGLRAEESPARAKKPRWSLDKTMSNSKRTVYNALPIHGWTETEVRDYLSRKSIPLHPVYQFLNRFSCQVCIYMTQRDLLAVKTHNPEAFQRISDLESEIGFTMQPGRSLSMLKPKI